MANSPERPDELDQVEAVLDAPDGAALQVPALMGLVLTPEQRERLLILEGAWGLCAEDALLRVVARGIEVEYTECVKGALGGDL